MKSRLKMELSNRPISTLMIRFASAKPHPSKFILPRAEPIREAWANPACRQSLRQSLTQFSLPPENGCENYRCNWRDNNPDAARFGRFPRTELQLHRLPG